MTIRDPTKIALGGFVFEAFFDMRKRHTDRPLGPLQKSSSSRR